MQSYSGDDITNVCRDAAFNGMRRQTAGMTIEQIRKMRATAIRTPILMDDLVQALARISPSVSKADIKRHEAWKRDFGSL